MNMYKKFFYGLLILTSTFLIGLAVFNYYIDPANQFFHARAFAEKASTFLLNNQKILISTNYNERLLQKIMLEKIKNRPEVLVLGSSHSLPITKDFFAGSSFYNASVSGAKLEDYLALYYIYQQRGWQPDVVVFCIDPWILENNFAELFLDKKMLMQWKTTLAFEYSNALKLILGASNQVSMKENMEIVFDKYSQLLTVDLFKASITNVLLRYAGIYLQKSNQLSPSMRAKMYYENIVPVLSGDQCPFCYTLLPDGSRLPTPNEESTSAEEADHAIVELIEQRQDLLTHYQNTPVLDPEYIKIFERFISYLLAHHVKIIFYFPPFEPKAYDTLVKRDPRYAKVLITEKYFRSLAEKYHMKIIGAYNPEVSNLHAEDFIDCWHLKEKGMRKVFNQRVRADESSRTSTGLSTPQIFHPLTLKRS